mgnify:FL=1
MTIGDVVIAVPAIQKLIIQDLPLPAAWRLSRLIGIVNPLLDFYNAEREKCKDEQAAMDLLALDISEQFEGYSPVCIPLDECLRLSAADVKATELFVAYTEVSK